MLHCQFKWPRAGKYIYILVDTCTCVRVKSTSQSTVHVHAVVESLCQSIVCSGSTVRFVPVMRTVQSHPIFTLCLISLQKHIKYLRQTCTHTYTLWLFHSTLAVYLLHDELAALTQFQLNKQVHNIP